METNFSSCTITKPIQKICKQLVFLTKYLKLIGPITSKSTNAYCHILYFIVYVTDMYHQASFTMQKVSIYQLFKKEDSSAKVM